MRFPGGRRESSRLRNGRERVGRGPLSLRRIFIPLHPFVPRRGGAESLARELEPPLLPRNIPGSFTSTVIRIDSSRPRSTVVKRRVTGRRRTVNWRAWVRRDAMTAGDIGREEILDRLWAPDTRRQWQWEFIKRSRLACARVAIGWISFRNDRQTGSR